MNCEKKESDDKNKNDSAATSLGWCARWWLLPHQSTSQHWFFLSLRVPQCLRDTNQHKSNIKACIKTWLRPLFFNSTSTLAFFLFIFISHFSCHGSSCLSAPTSYTALAAKRHRLKAQINESTKKMNSDQIRPLKKHHNREYM